MIFPAGRRAGGRQREVLAALTDASAHVRSRRLRVASGYRALRSNKRVKRSEIDSEGHAPFMGVWVGHLRLLLAKRETGEIEGVGFTRRRRFTADISTSHAKKRDENSSFNVGIWQRQNAKTVESI